MARWMIVGILGLGGCGGSGVCVGTGGILDQCKEGFSTAECDEWDDESVNGSTWSWDAGSCESAGFDVQCDDGTWVYSSSDCAEYGSY